MHRSNTFCSLALSLTFLSMFSIAPNVRAMKTDPSCIVINDFSGMNSTCASVVTKPATEDDIRAALLYASSNGLKVSMAGEQHTMAGQSLTPGGLLIDMKSFNKILKLDTARKTILVQAGATWKQIQSVIDAKGLAIDVMQNYNIFTVGGSVSVNALGLNMNSSTISSNIQSLKIMLADGTVLTASRDFNSEIFRLAIGGYGLFGVILEAEIKLTSNVAHKVKSHKIDYQDFPSYFAQNLAGKDGMFDSYFSLSPNPDRFMKDIVILSYTPDHSKVPKPVERRWFENFMNPILAGVVNNSSESAFWRRVVWFLQSKILVHTIPDSVSRNQLMSRPMPPIAEAEDNESFVIQSYFVSKSNFTQFVDRLRTVVLQNNPPIVTASIMNLNQDEIAELSTGRGEDKFVIVLGFVQQMNAEGEERMNRFASEMIDQTIELGGTLYLAHRMAYSKNQLDSLYPNSKVFFDMKRKYDPTELFSNRLYERYGRNPSALQTR
jgi:decaprenylphospho-beta-D-ribofuranose 2-oxidase